MVGDFVARFKRLVDELDLEHAKELIALSEKKYAINIVPDIIKIFGDSDHGKIIPENARSWDESFENTKKTDLRQKRCKK